MTQEPATSQLRASVVVLMYNDSVHIRSCLQAASAQSLPAEQYEIIVVDNGSCDGCLDLVRQTFPAVRVLALEQNLGFAEGNNHGAALARGEWVVFLNSDTEVAFDWLEQLLGVVESAPDVGAAHGAQRFDWEQPADGSPAPLRVPDCCRWGYVRYLTVPAGANAFATRFASGATLMLRRSWIEQDGPAFDSSFFLYGEDYDLSLRLSIQGYRLLAVPAAVLEHHQGNPLERPAQTWRKACLAARNHWRANLKCMYLGEFLLYTPAVLLGSLRKPWEFPGSQPTRLAASLGLLALTAAYWPTTLWHHVRFPQERRRALAGRRRPRGWLLRHLWRRSMEED